jgi:hypothetical protein
LVAPGVPCWKVSEGTYTKSIWRDCPAKSRGLQRRKPLTVLHQLPLGHWLSVLQVPPSVPGAGPANCLNPESDDDVTVVDPDADATRR